MRKQSRYELLELFRFDYSGATKRQKQLMLDEFCALSGYNRKYAIRLLNASHSSREGKKAGKRGRKKLYDDPLIEQVLRDLWVATNLPCGKRLVAIIPLWLPHYDNYIVPDDVYDKLMSISAATIDRILKPIRGRYAKQGFATTKPGTILKKHIPVKTNQWDESVPGFLEADTVAHCGNSTAGMFVYSINCVDIASGWTEQRAVWGKGQTGVLEAIRHIESTLPFPIRGFDCDNGSEFLNWHLMNFLTQRKHPVQFTRSRAYHKNDNAHVENKNWTNIRQYLGYQRFEHSALTQMLNELYTSQWSLYFNCFIPSVKLQAKTRRGSKTIKTHDAPKTPVQRLLESDHIPTTQKKRLREMVAELNPFELQRAMAAKIKRFLAEVNRLTTDQTPVPQHLNPGPSPQTAGPGLAATENTVL